MILHTLKFFFEWRIPSFQRRKQGLEPPKRGYFKVNVDVATNSEKQISGLGAVIRDENGNVIAVAIKVSKYYGEATFAEA